MKSLRGTTQLMALAPIAWVLLLQPGCAQPPSWLPSAVSTLRLSVAVAKATVPRAAPASQAVCVALLLGQAERVLAAAEECIAKHEEPERACAALGQQVLNSALDVTDALSGAGSTCR